MKQAVLQAPGVFELREVPQPIPGPGQALIRVRAVGICGSDIHAYLGRHPFISCPVVPGHEAAGEVVALGEGAQGLNVGDRVVLRPQQVCGQCLPCKTGRYNICNTLQVLGCQQPGAASEFYAAPAHLLYRLPPNLDFAAGTVVEPLAVGVHAAKKGLPGGLEGKKVLVVGAGTIGNMVAQSAAALGAASVLIADISDEKLAMAARCGLSQGVNSAREYLAAAVHRAFGGDGADAIYECTAAGEALGQVLSFARKGSRIVIVGVYEQPVQVNMAVVQDREYELIGSLMYTHEDYVDALAMAAAGRVRLEEAITHRWPLDEIAGAYRFVQENPGQVLKAVLTV